MPVTKDFLLPVAVFGSAFNPPTKGHQDAIEQLLDQGYEVWLVPSFKHAWGKNMASYESRCQLLQAFGADLNLPLVKVMNVEHYIATEDRPVYSLTLLSWLQSQYPERQFALAIGPDNHENFSSFFGAETILKTWPLVVAKQRKPIRSTLVRSRVAQHQPIDDMVTPGTRQMIAELGLYQEIPA